MALVFSNSTSNLLEPGIKVLQLLLSIRTLRSFRRLPVVGSHEDPLEGKARVCGSGSGLACVSRLGSVLLCNDEGDMIVVVVLVSLQRAKDDSFPAFFSCVQATLGVVGKQRELLSIYLNINTMFFSLTVLLVPVIEKTYSAQLRRNLLILV